MKMIIYLFDQQLRKTETNECGLLFFMSSVCIISLGIYKTQSQLKNS